MNEYKFKEIQADTRISLDDKEPDLRLCRWNKNVVQEDLKKISLEVAAVNRETWGRGHRVFWNGIKTQIGEGNRDNPRNFEFASWVGWKGGALRRVQGTCWHSADWGRNQAADSPDADPRVDKNIPAVPLSGNRTLNFHLSEPRHVLTRS